MARKENQAPHTGIQVFELTMDNPEDQDKLNRQLHKPGEPNNGSSATYGREVQDKSTTAEKPSRNNG